MLEVSASGYYGWRDRPVCARDLADAYLTNAYDRQPGALAEALTPTS